VQAAAPAAAPVAAAAAAAAAAPAGGIGAVAVLLESGLESSTHVLSLGVDLFNVDLKLQDAATNSNKFYKMQVCIWACWNIFLVLPLVAHLQVHAKLI
jgi:hypothetical protein